ncbi:MAG: Mrp/NBP35 family ATP-binding protein [Halococcoides sp.]
MDVDTAREQLRRVEDPDLDDDIVSLGLVNDLQVENGTVQVDLALGAPFAPTETAIAESVREAIDAPVELSASLPAEMTSSEVLSGVTNVIAVASGKGGVGKSTVAVNLAAGLADLGADVGLFDADIYGPSVPHMLDADERAGATDDDRIEPPEKHGLKLMSIDFLLGDEEPVIWRGPMVHNLLTELFEDVAWGDLDYMVVDLPPGTGDAQLTLLQTVPVTGAVVVTTPQPVAVADARKGLDMFGEHETPVLGIVENMSTFQCPDCGSSHDIFGTGGGETLAAEADLPYLGSIPLDPSIREHGDSGAPIVRAEGETAAAFGDFAETTADMQGLVHRQQVADR